MSVAQEVEELSSRIPFVVMYACCSELPPFRGFLTMATPEEPMGSFPSTRPTLVVHSSTSCPRCDGVCIRSVGVDAESAFEWRECLGCSFLWGLPRGWTRADGPLVSRAHQGAARW